MAEPAANEMDESLAPEPGGGGAPEERLELWWQYTHRVDTQKRTQFPAEWRKFTKQPFMLVLWPHEAAPTQEFAFIKAMPKRKFDRMLDRLAKAGLGNKQAALIRRKILPNSCPLQIDQAGRLCLPPVMAGKVKIDKEVFFAGVGDHIELWNPESYGACTNAEGGDLQAAMENLLTDET